MKLVILTKSTFFVEEDKILSSLFDVGMERLHLYKPGTSPLFSERLLSLLKEEYHKKITVHEHFYLQNEYNLRGIHLSDATTPVPGGFKGKLSRNCSSVSELKIAKKNADYVFLKNIFDCIEFKDEYSNFTMLELERAAKEGLIDKKVYAMGGMTLNNINIARDLGFGGVVVCGDLWSRFDIQTEKDFVGVLNYFEKLRKAVE